MQHRSVTGTTRRASQREQARRRGDLEHERYHREVTGQFAARKGRPGFTIRLLGAFMNHPVLGFVVILGLSLMLYGLYLSS